jgi:hypothetical protein
MMGGMRQQLVKPLGRVLAGLRKDSPETWRNVVLGALEAADGDVSRAAGRLEVALRTMQRWVGEEPFFGRFRKGRGRPPGKSLKRLGEKPVEKK